MAKKKAVVLLSGGLDSATVLYYAKKHGYECHCLLFNYGQRHKKELAHAGKLAAHAGSAFRTVTISLPWGGSSLLGNKQPLPLHKASAVDAHLPATYVPGRNTVFISFALSYAETLGAAAIFIGANAIDYSGYPDCRPEYYDAWNVLLKALGRKISIKIPLLHLDKAQIIKLGTRLGVPYEYTWSCYAGSTKPCGLCDSCRIRARGFAQAGVIDKALNR